jgi:predicted aspartyl protease
VAPATALRRIGLEPDGTNTYELADGSFRDYAFTCARLDFMGSTVVSRIVFGPDEAEPLLGVLALEAAGIEVDPANQRLKKLPALRLKAFAAA